MIILRALVSDVDKVDKIFKIKKKLISLKQQLNIMTNRKISFGHETLLLLF